MLKSLILAAAFSLAALAAPPAGVPAGAEKIAGAKWRHTDAKGTTWIYVQTPFGVARLTEEQDKAGATSKGPEQKQKAPSIEVVAVREKEADFQRVTPFGKARWTRPLDGLTGDEKAALEAAARKK